MEEEQLSTEIENIKNLIYTIRGKQVMLDSDVAKLYNCETKYINRVVKRNIERFPKEFCFQLTEKEFECLRCQIVTLNNNKRGQHRKYLPYVFSEQGIAMLSALAIGDVPNRSKNITKRTDLKHIVSGDTDFDNTINSSNRSKIYTHHSTKNNLSPRCGK